MTSGPPLPEGRTLDLPGRGRTFVREVPAPRPGAPTVVLLHGWTASADLNWFPAYAPLGRHFRVLALDHRGHGRGIRSWRPFRLEDCADDVAALLGALDAGPAVVVGYSMGGPIAQLTWRRHRDAVSGLVLCATAAGFGGWRGDRAFFSAMLGLSVAAQVTPGVVRRQVMDRVIHQRLQGRLNDWAVEELRRNDPASVLQAGSAIGRFDSRRWIGGVDVPTASLITTDDNVVPVRRQESLAAAIPGNRVQRVAGDHAVCVSAPQRFVPVLVDACRDVADRAAAAAVAAR